MQLIPLNAKVLIFLYFTISIINHIDCSASGDLNVAASTNTDVVGDVVQVPQDIEASVDDPATVDTKKIVVNSVGTAKRLRNAVYGSRHNSYRSSYVGNKFDRRAALAETAEAENNATESNVTEINATEHVPLIKAKRKLYNEFNDEVKYNVGPGVNIGVEKDKELVSVYLDEDCLKDVFTGSVQSWASNRSIIWKIETFNQYTAIETILRQ